MKKIILSVALCAVAFATGAMELTTNSNSTETISTQGSVIVIYDGPAYSAGSGLIPSADGSVNVYWTDQTCTVNGRETTAYKISGGTFMMRVNGKSKAMTHYVNYGGDRYYFSL